MQTFIGTWILILFGRGENRYYLEGFHFWCPCHTLVPNLRELPIYTPTHPLKLSLGS